MSNYDLLKEYDMDQLYEIKKAAEWGIKEEHINRLYKKDMSPSQMRWILDGFKKGLTVEKVELYANSQLHYDEMQIIQDAILYKFSQEEIELLRYTAFNTNFELEEVFNCIAQGLTVEEIKRVLEKDKEDIYYLAEKKANRKYKKRYIYK